MATIKVSTTKNVNRAINYAEKRATVENGYNCDINNVKEEMAVTREIYNKTDGIQAHLVIQSFSPEESHLLGYDKINQLGVELAERIAPEHQVGIYTHTDKEHIHNHLVINSVNFETGYKYQAHGTKALDFFKQQNDNIARENGLEIVQKQALERHTMAEIKIHEKGMDSWKQHIRESIDETMQNATTTSYGRFKESLEEKGINVYERGNRLTYEDLETNKKVVDNKLGEDYRKKNVFLELNQRQSVFQNDLPTSRFKQTEAHSLSDNQLSIKNEADKERQRQQELQAQKQQEQELVLERQRNFNRNNNLGLGR